MPAGIILMNAKGERSTISTKSLRKWCEDIKAIEGQQTKGIKKRKDKIEATYLVEKVSNSK